jgi:hypothetical protein
LAVTSGNHRLSVIQGDKRRDRVGANLAQQRGEVVVEALAQHQPVAEGQDHHEGLHDGAAAGSMPRKRLIWRSC